MGARTLGVSRAGMLCLPAVLVLASLHAAQVDGQPLPRGPELQVNNYTPGDQSIPDVAANGSGFVVTWLSFQDGSTSGIRARRFDAEGNAASGEIQVNVHTLNLQQEPSIASNTSGFAVVWQSNLQDGDGLGIFGRRFDPSGNPVAVEFQVNSATVGFQIEPDIAMDDTGFVVVWASTSGSPILKVFGRRYDSSGNPVTAPFVISTYLAGDQYLPSVALNGSGGFVVVWQGSQDGGSFGIFGRRFNSSAGAVGAEFQINTYTPTAQLIPNVAMDGSGFVVAWESLGQESPNEGSFARRFNAQGVPIATEFQVNTVTLGEQRLPAVAMAAGGDFVVAFQSQQEGSSNGVFLRRFEADTAPVGPEIRVNTFTSGDQTGPVLAFVGSRFLVSWNSNLQDGSGEGVFAQRFRLSDFTLDVDGDGSVDPLTDALLILRFAFGFRGATLVTGAVDLIGCTRCDAAAIEGYLTGEF